MGNRSEGIDKLITFSLNNLFFYRAKSISLDVRSYHHAEAILLNPDAEHFPHLKGKFIRLNESINANCVYETAKYLIEEKTVLSRPDLDIVKPFDTRHSYIGLRYTSDAKLPCPVMISSISKGPGSFYLQFSAQNLEQKLDILRAELDAWNIDMRQRGMLGDIAKALVV